MTPPRSALCLAAALALLPASICGQVTAPPLAPDLPPDVAALLAPLPAWNRSARVYAGFGYKDNLLLGHANEERSSFVRGGFDLLVFHPPRHRFDATLYVTGEASHYFTGRSVDHDALAAVLAEGGYALADAFKFTLDLRGDYFDEVLDLSDSDFQQVVAAIEKVRVTVAPRLRWTIVPACWVEVEAAGEREYYRETTFNGKIGEGTLRLGGRIGSRVQLAAAATDRAWHYDQRDQFSAAGRELAGTRLAIAEREGSLRADVKWDAAGHFKTTTRVSTLRHADNGSGYFSFHLRRVTQEFDWENDRWLVHAEGSAARQEYDVQTVGFGLAPPPRVRDAFAAQFRIERKLSERWTLLGEYNWERSRCNDPIASYNMNEGMVGARWSWER